MNSLVNNLTTTVQRKGTPRRHLFNGTICSQNLSIHHTTQRSTVLLRHKMGRLVQSLLKISDDITNVLNA
ncbi:hypothetical protein VDGE_30444 [Verticillium dahliae]|uniref:Uncharacterized protein n=1 Tax=Verticillium dahliae TaxID=27337 RepID=A0A444S1D1_VERDA|nr:hypothetical protein VDGE_30444 [Verticillium dahliae]